MITTLVAELEEPGCKSKPLSNFVVFFQITSWPPFLYFIFSPIDHCISICNIWNHKYWAFLSACHRNPAATPPICTFICCRSIPLRPPLELCAGCLPGWLWGLCPMEGKGALSMAGRAHTWAGTQKCPLPGGVLVRAGAWSAMGYKPQRVRLVHSSPWEPVVFKGNHVDPSF